MYNPAYNPSLLAHNAMPSVARDFEQDPRVRYLINLGDVVSMGGWGGEGPKNVVYRTPIGNTIHWSETGGGLDPLHLHQLRQWQGSYTGLPEYKPEPTPEDTALPQSRLDEMQKPWRPVPVPYSGPSGLDIYNTNDELDSGTLEETDVLDFGDDEDFLDDLRERLGDF